MIKDISFEINRGEFVVLAGQSGCGKSTLLKTFMKLLPVEEGEVLLNQTNIEQINHKSLWSSVSYCTNDFVIFTDDINYNNALNTNKADDERLFEIIESVDLKDFIDRQDKGFNTLIKKDIISDGECQKIQLARALYENKDIYLWDEPFSKLSERAMLHVPEAVLEYCRRERKIKS